MTNSTPTNTRLARSGRVGALAAAIALSAAGILLPATALAAPGSPADAPAASQPTTNTLPDDSGLTVAPIGHVDSPKTYFENGNFELYGDLSATTKVRVDQTINHLGKGYRGAAQKYAFTIPAGAPELDFLGKGGETWYMGHFNSEVAAFAIWSGFGADTNIPVDEFRDAVFTLDLVSVDGPGRVELLNWFAGDDEDSAGQAMRLLSSTDPAYRSYFLEPGSHTHNYTMFSAPGRYEMTYRVSARKTDGTLLTSPERVLRWQVGGARPDEVGKSTSSVSTATAPTLSVGAATGAKEPDASVVPLLDRLRVDMGADVAGTATFLINGYKLADVALSGGVAELVELLGSASNEIQVQVRGTDGKVVFTSAPVTYRHGGQAASTSKAVQELAPRVPAPTNTFPATEVTASKDPSVTVEVAPGPKGTLTAKFALDDVAAAGATELALFAAKGDKTAEATVRFVAGGPQEYQLSLNDAEYYEDYYLKARFVPHPLVKNLQSSEVEVAASYDPADTVTATLRIPHTEVSQPSESANPKPSESANPKPSESASADTTTPPTDTATPLPSQSASTAPTPAPGPAVEQCPSGQPQVDKGMEFDIYQGRIAIESGHLDLAAVKEGEAISLRVKDDTRTASRASVMRSACHVAIVVPAAAKLKRAPSGEGWDHILPADGSFGWHLPQVQKAGLPWPGYSTDHLSYSELNRASFLDLVSVEGPGEVTLYTYDAVDRKATVLLGSRAGNPATLEIDGPVHAHPAWAFSKPGEYKVNLRYRVTTKGGVALTSPVSQVVFVVQDRQPQPQDPAPSAKVKRLAGADRVDTALAVAKEMPVNSTAAVLSTGSNWPDALAAAPLARALNAPLLLTSSAKLERKVLDALVERGVKKVYVVGGVSSVPAVVSTQLTDAKIEVERVAGADRYTTSIEVAKRAKQIDPTIGRVMVATGTNYPDALAAGSVSGPAKSVTVLSAGTKLPMPVREFLTKSGLEISSVGAGAAAAVTSAKLSVAHKFSGVDRYETAAALAKQFAPKGGAVVVASGELFADALGGGAFAANSNGVLVLTKAGVLPPASRSVLAHVGKPAGIFVTGGERSVSGAVLAELDKLMR